MWSDATRGAIKAMNAYLLVQSTDEISHYSPEDELAAHRKPPTIRGLMVNPAQTNGYPGLNELTGKTIGHAGPPSTNAIAKPANRWLGK
jgi:hypothetical protein